MDKFDSLREWFSLDEEDIKSQFDSDAKKVVSELLKDLAEPGLQKVAVDVNNFPDLVTELHSLMVVGSRQFGEALLSAEELAGRGDAQKAISVLECFIDDNPSDFYRKMALSQIKRIKNSGQVE